MERFPKRFYGVTVGGFLFYPWNHGEWDNGRLEVLVPRFVICSSGTKEIKWIFFFYFFLQMKMSVCRNIYLAQVLKNSLYKLKKLLAFTPEIENF